MPMYEYQCRACDADFEVLVLGDEKVECPECQSDRLVKQFSVPGAPKMTAGSLPMGCDTSAPPCGPGCCRM